MLSAHELPCSATRLCSSLRPLAQLLSLAAQAQSADILPLQWLSQLADVQAPSTSWWQSPRTWARCAPTAPLPSSPAAAAAAGAACKPMRAARLKFRPARSPSQALPGARWTLVHQRMAACSSLLAQMGIFVAGASKIPRYNAQAAWSWEVALTQMYTCLHVAEACPGSGIDICAVQSARGANVGQ